MSAGSGYNYNLDVTEPVKRVYDMSYYGHDYTFYPLDPSPSLVTTITNSTATRGAVNTSSNTASATQSAQPITAMWDLIFSNTDNIALLGPANNTDLNTSFQLTPDMTALVHEVNFNVWFGMNVSAWTSGAPNLTAVGFTVSYQDTGEVIGTGNFPTGFSALGATGAQIYNMNITIPKPFIVTQERTLLFNFTTTSVTTGTNTRQLGICSAVSYGKQLGTAIPLMVQASCVRLHIHPTVSHVNPNFISGQGLYP